MNFPKTSLKTQAWGQKEALRLQIKLRRTLSFLQLYDRFYDSITLHWLIPTLKHYTADQISLTNFSSKLSIF
jgi:hypothetical protein